MIPERETLLLIIKVAAAVYVIWMIGDLKNVFKK